MISLLLDLESPHSFQSPKNVCFSHSAHSQYIRQSSIEFFIFTVIQSSLLKRLCSRKNCKLYVAARHSEKKIIRRKFVELRAIIYECDISASLIFCWQSEMLLDIRLVHLRKPAKRETKQNRMISTLLLDSVSQYTLISEAPNIRNSHIWLGAVVHSIEYNSQ